MYRSPKEETPDGREDADREDESRHWGFFRCHARPPWLSQPLVCHAQTVWASSAELPPHGRDPGAGRVFFFKKEPLGGKFLREATTATSPRLLGSPAIGFAPAIGFGLGAERKDSGVFVSFGLRKGAEA